MTLPCWSCRVTCWLHRSDDFKNTLDKSAGKCGSKCEFLLTKSPKREKLDTFGQRKVEKLQPPVSQQFPKECLRIEALWGTATKSQDQFFCFILFRFVSCGFVLDTNMVLFFHPPCVQAVLWCFHSVPTYWCYWLLFISVTCFLGVALLYFFAKVWVHIRCMHVYKW